MLLLTFRVAEDLYAVAVERVVEVVPRVELHPIPHAPAFLAGLLSYRGKIVPVVDLGVLMGSVACRSRLQTRIILVDDPSELGKGLLGLVGEQVSDIKRLRDDQEVFPSMQLEQAPYLGAVLRTEEGLVQLISVGQVLPLALREALYGHPLEMP